MTTYMALIREVADKLDKDFNGNLDFAIAELYSLSLRLQSVLWVKEQISKAFAFNSCGAEKKLTNNLLKENDLK